MPSRPNDHESYRSQSTTPLFQLTYRPIGDEQQRRCRFVPRTDTDGLWRIEEVATADGWRFVGREAVTDLRAGIVAPDADGATQESVER